MLLCVQLFNISMGGSNSNTVCFSHSHNTSLFKTVMGKLINTDATDDNGGNNGPAEEKAPETCDFADIVLYHLHNNLSLPSLFHIERKNDNHHFMADVKSHVLEVVSPPPEC